MKKHHSTLRSTNRLGSALAVATFIILGSLGPVWAKKGGGGRPGGGGEDPPPPPPPASSASVDYEITWLAGLGGQNAYVEDVNSAGIAVGEAQVADGRWGSFIATPETDMMLASEFFTTGGWQLPEGWWTSFRSPRINESNLLTGLLYKIEPTQASQEIALFIVDLNNPGPIEPVYYFAPGDGGIPMDINENGDVLLNTSDGPHIYCFAEGVLIPISGADQLNAVAMNDNRDVTLQSSADDMFGWGEVAFRYTWATDQIENLGDGLRRGSKTWGRDITNDGTVYGHSDVRNKQTAGLTSPGSTAWAKINSDVPQNATALSAKESGQVLVGFNAKGRPQGGTLYDLGTSLWIDDLNEGLSSVADILVGDLEDIALFYTVRDFIRVELSEPNDSGYGVIAGSVGLDDSGAPWTGFILTPVTR